MVANIMETHRKNKNIPEIKKWIQKIRNGKYRVSKKYFKKLREEKTFIKNE